jgi:hypothetical protein
MMDMDGPVLGTNLIQGDGTNGFSINILKNKRMDL